MTDANILLADQAIFVTSGSDGVFTISKAAPGKDVLRVIASGYEDAYIDVDILDGMVRNLGDIRLTRFRVRPGHRRLRAFLFDEEEVLDDEGLGQSIGTIRGATDDVYYQTANYDFSIARFRFRGYEQNWQAGYVNGFRYNDAMRGRFNYSMFGGMTSSAFRNPHHRHRSRLVGLRIRRPPAERAATPPTHPNMPRAGKETYPIPTPRYMLRAMMQYATGLNRHGWAFTMSIIGRYAPEGCDRGYVL